MSKLDCITHEDEKLYHSRSRNGEFVSSHLLATFARSPFKYHQTITGQTEDTDKPEYAFGRATHKLILEGSPAFDEAYTVADGPVNPKTGLPFGKTTQAYQTWLDNQPKEVISVSDYETMYRMSQSCWLHREVSQLLSSQKEGEAEGVVRASVENVPCQIRMDFFSTEVGIVDLKTCRDIEFFEKDCRDFGYAYQLSFYQSVLAAACGVKFPVHIIAVDKTEFHIAGRWDIPQTVLDECAQVNLASIRRLAKCRETGVWPTGYEQTRIFTLNR